MVDEELKSRVQRAIYEEQRGIAGGQQMLDVPRESSERKTGLNESGVAGLPPPSSDRSKWWLDDGELPDETYRHLSSGIMLLHVDAMPSPPCLQH